MDTLIANTELSSATQGRIKMSERSSDDPQLEFNEDGIEASIPCATHCSLRFLEWFLSGTFLRRKRTRVIQ